MKRKLKSYFIWVDGSMQAGTRTMAGVADIAIEFLRLGKIVEVRSTEFTGPIFIRPVPKNESRHP